MEWCMACSSSRIWSSVSARNDADTMACPYVDETIGRSASISSYIADADAHSPLLKKRSAFFLVRSYPVADDCIATSNIIDSMLNKRPIYINNNIKRRQKVREELNVRGIF